MQSYAYSFSAMGTDCRIVLGADEEGNADQIADCVMAEVERIEQKYSRYLDDNTLAQINHAALTAGAIVVDEETATLLDYAFAAFRLSDGLFDISSGALRKVWNFSGDTLPSQAEIDDILPRIGLDKVRWNSPTLQFLHPNMELDFGGMGKEYAVDRAADICASLGIKSGLLDFGGDIRVIGSQPSGLPWQIGVSHPRNTDVSLGNVGVNSAALATSGDYERYIEVAGKRYCHVLNPRTGWPNDQLLFVTVLADQCLLAGTLSTIALLKGEEGKMWLEKLNVQHCWMDNQLNFGGNIQLST